MTIHSRKCDQQITGRNFQYSNALEIIQDESYLDGADFDDIRARRYLKKQRKKKRDLKYDATLLTTYPVFANPFFATSFGRLENIITHDLTMLFIRNEPVVHNYCINRVGLSQDFIP